MNDGLRPFEGLFRGTIYSIILWLLLLVAIIGLLSGCETIGYLRERNQPAWPPMHPVFDPHLEDVPPKSELEGNV
jgi:hypothetical protein